MVEDDVFQKLAQLTNRQREVLKRVCAGNDYKTIAGELVISEDTVKSHVGNIYVKLGLDQMPVSLRKKAIFETYCPALHEAEFKSIPDDPIEPEPVPQAIQKMVDHDNLLIFQTDKKPVIQILPPPPPPIRPKWGLIAVLLVVIVLAIIGGFKVYDWANGLIHPVIPLSTSTPVKVYTIITATPLPVTSTPVPSSTSTEPPTATPFPPSPTPIIPTPTSKPLVTLPFKDNFSNGINPPWQILSGTWMTTDGGATITIQDLNNPTGTIIIDDPTLTNYRLKVNVYVPHVLAASQGSCGVVVRLNQNKDQNLVYYYNSASRFQWGYLPSLYDLPFNSPSITSEVNADPLSSFTLEIDVSGNTFTAKVNGAKFDEFTLSGYANGGIALITSCGNIGSCPAFSNFSLEPLP